MAVNPNWPRWIVASVASYFKQVADNLNLKMIVEGIDEREPGKMNVDHAELRINGPFTRELSKGYYLLHVDTNVLLTDLMEGAHENPYDLMTWSGAFQQAAWKPIPVFRYGPDIDGIDDAGFVGCLLPRGRNEASKVFHFGQISVNDRVRQSAVDTRHQMEIYDPTSATYLHELWDLVYTGGSPLTFLSVAANGANLTWRQIQGEGGITITFPDDQTCVISDTGSGFEYYTAEAFSEIGVGNAIYLKANGHADLAQANGTPNVSGLAISQAMPGNSCHYITEGKVEKADWTETVGTATLSPGATYFLDPYEAGHLTPIAPVTVGQYVVRVGKAVSTTRLDVEIESPILL